MHTLQVDHCSPMNRGTLTLLLIMVLLGTTSAVAGVLIPDSHTLILDHFDQSTVGTPHGSPGYQPGPPGFQSAVYLGQSSYIQYALLPSLETQGTIEMWLKPDSTDMGIMDFNWNDTTSYPGAGHVLHLTLDAAGEITISGWAWNPANMYSLTSAGAVTVGQWSHIALSWSSAGARVYLNGVLSASSNQPWQPAIPQWAYLNYWGDTGVGAIDELRISDIQRTDEEIAADASVAPEASTWVLVLAGVCFLVLSRMRGSTLSRRPIPDPRAIDSME